MPAFHSTFAAEKNEICGIAKIPTINAATAPQPPANFSHLPHFSSITDEALYLYRANIFYRNFELKTPSDRTLLYATLYIQECLHQIGASKPIWTRKDAEKNLLVSASAPNFPIPGDSNFHLSALFPVPQSNSERESLRAYLTELRVALVHGLLDRLYAKDPFIPDRTWMSLSKRKFMNKQL